MEPLRSFLDQVQISAARFLPNLLVAILLVSAGWVIGKLLKIVVRRLVAGLDKLLPRKAWRFQQVQIGRPLPDIIGSFVFWIVIVLFAGLATESLGLAVVTNWLESLAVYLPRVLLAVLIVLSSVVAGKLASDTTEATASRLDVAHGRALGRLAHFVILLVGVMAAVDQIGIETSFFANLITILVATVLGGAAVAFGLGARSAVSNILASHQLQKNYQVGQSVRLGDFEGRIVEITSTAVLLQGLEGQILIPAEKFNQEVSVRLRAGERK